MMDYSNPIHNPIDEREFARGSWAELDWILQMLKEYEEKESEETQMELCPYCKKKAVSFFRKIREVNWFCCGRCGEIFTNPNQRDIYYPKAWGHKDIWGLI